MTRLARVVVPDVPHHITQRGNRRQPTFFGDDDYATYLRLLAASCAEHGVAVWAWCLMPNHVHPSGGPLVAEVTDCRAFLAAEEDQAVVERLRRHARTGRPLGDAGFITRLEADLGRRLRRRKPGPKAKPKR